MEATDNQETPEDLTPEAGDEFVAPEVREQKRLSRKPSIDHLKDGVLATDDGLGGKMFVPVFDVGDRIVVERHSQLLPGNPWLDTRVYLVKDIHDEGGLVHCWDEELQHYACMAFDRPDVQRIKLPPKRGNPFRAPRASDGKPLQNSSVLRGEDAPKKKGRGRPKGSKNRPKEEIRQERLERREAKKR
jgi:hypothetical protein